ncbi:GMC family oxidoreductase [Catellatospora citrea]|uniref:GMC oxidoreductase n=1 Tax=Catellatospora citrea TaxID=53366 RepID=A0A8J3KBZ3_9ACTN|nr:GMC family oxidoreductase N-terminal domain-containing protein [Catellatospora citrea]RKE05498.1 choline dehydrogenase [Catellatospora citrea]GIG00173.1 GMC oxidoreductase [Catellatospora citrea]
MEFDYVIVGAGSAGCVLAARLSEQPDVSVLLLETGPADTRPEIHVPTAWPTLWGTEVDYGYRTVPQSAMGGLEHTWPRGRTLGGSSSINAMVYLRGHRNDFDSWAEGGADGWAYDDVLPYFQRMETVPDGDLRYRGFRGPMMPQRSAAPNPISQVFVDAAAQVGHPVTRDFNGAVQAGVGWHDLSICDGKRQSTAAAYLQQALRRANLTVWTESRATSLFVREGRCTGVLVRRDCELVDVRAAREVIVSSGAVDSPRLLLLSGIGPADELRQAGVTVVHDLPGVGRNLQDHPLTSVVFEATQQIPPGNTNHAETSLLCHSSEAVGGPDMQIMFIHVPFHRSAFDTPANSFTFGVSVVPRSRGTIRLANADPDSSPLIDPNYLSDPSDRLRLAEGVEQARTVAAAPAFDSWRGFELLPGGNMPVDDYVRTGTGTYFHPAGSCKMGTDEQSVVTPQLRVRGIDNLRVIDASVMPTLVSVNTNAATIMIAEHGAELIRTGV